MNNIIVRMFYFVVALLSATTAILYYMEDSINLVPLVILGFVFIHSVQEIVESR